MPSTIYTLFRRLSTVDGTTYDSLKKNFDAGKLVGDAMNQCYLFVQHAVQNFPAEQVTSPHVHSILLVIFSLFLLCLVAMALLRRPVSLT
jgi:hypothetical protein